MTSLRKSVFIVFMVSVLVIVIAGCSSKKKENVEVSHKASEGMSEDSNALYFYNIAERLSILKNVKEAEGYYSRAIKADPGFSAAYMGKGILFYGIDNEKALKHLTKAIEVDKYYFKAYYNRAVILIQLEKYQDAVSDFTKAITLMPAYASAYYNRGHLYVKLKQPEKALEDYNKTIGLKKDDPTIYFQRGMLRLNENLGDRGLSDFLKAASLNPKDYKAIYNVACIYSIKGDFENTEIYLKKAIKAGFKQFPLLKKDPDLENFRKSSKFGEFLKSIEK